MLAIFHGENRLEQEEAIAELLAQLHFEDVSGLNKVILESPLAFSELRLACDTLPFLGESRLVLVRGALTQENDAWAQQVADYLPALAPFTHLFFVEGKTVPLSHPVLKTARQLGATLVSNALPKSKEVPQWVTRRAQKLGLRLEPAALALLVQNLGSQVQLVDQELRKLQAYKGGAGVITAEDVRVMMPYMATADVIFELVDAIGQRRPDVAVRHLSRLMDPGTRSDEYLRIFGMIVRQFRLLLQTRWLVDRGCTQSEIIERLALHPYVAEKMALQARLFSLQQLRQAYRLLYAADLTMKTGQMSYPMTLEVLIAQLCRV